MLEKIKTSLDKSVATVSIKSSEFIEINKLKTQISSAEVEIKAKKQEVGAAIYKRWTENQRDMGEAESICEEIREIELSIDALKLKTEELLEQNKRILNTSGEGITCKCGAKNIANAKFCVNCGEKLEYIASISEQEGEIKTCICGANVKKEAKFCPKCGDKFELQAAEDEIAGEEDFEKEEADERANYCECGAEKRSGAKFCPKCGTKYNE